MRNIIKIVLAFSFTGCSHNGLAPIDYANYIESSKSGLHAQYENNQYVFSVFYKPIDYVTLRDFSSGNIDRNVFMEFRKKYDENCYFSLNITPKDNTKKEPAKQESDQSYASYLDFGLQKDIKLIAGTDTISCNLFHHEPMGGVTSTEKFVMSFNIPDCKDCDYNILYSGNAFTEVPVSLSISKEKINNTPTISL